MLGLILVLRVEQVQPQADFLYLNCSKAATAGRALHGVGGGVALCGGVGPMATAVVVDQETREEALLIEPEGQYIVKSNSLGPDFRLYSQPDLVQ
jgi:hypothetical protein